MTDETYLKMILALPDSFFEGWEWKAGDKLHHKGDNEIYLVTRVTLDAAYANRINKVTASMEIKFSHVIPDAIRPIPTQEQLQKMIKAYNNSIGIGMFDYCLITKIGIWCYNQPVELVQDKNIDCLTLMFYMWLTDRTWNGESWV